MAAIITDVFKTKLLQRIFTDVSNDSDKFYIGIGKSEQWDSAENVPTPTDTPRTIRQVRSALQSVKKTNDVTFTIPRYNWTPGTYNAYDDNFASIPSNSYYVLTEDNQVYICLQQSKDSNGNANTSTVKPTGTATKPFKTSDGYVWKFLYALSAIRSSKFLSSNFVPVEKILDSSELGRTLTTTEQTQDAVQNAASPGQIIGIEMINNGAGYTGSTVAVTVNGDGTGAAATGTVSGGSVVKIELDSSTDSCLKFGHGYNFASITVANPASGTNVATARAVFGPDSGMGADPRNELKSTSLMFNAKPNGTESTTQAVSGDTTAGSSFIIDQDFRQVAIMRDLKDSAGVNLFTGTSGKILKYLNFTTVPTFPKDAIITGAGGGQAVVDTVDSSRVWFHQNDSTGFKSFIAGETVSGGGTSATLDSANGFLKNGDVDKLSGEILYIENRAPVVRAANQTEDIKVVITL
tara:strand:- start:1257 stop:2651 length:1395 start_codon:yes stop_codon:yes gene_type:complete